MIRNLKSLSPALVAVTAFIGCGGPEGGANQLETYDITAKVTVDGKPLGGASLSMSPTDPNAGLPNSGASLSADGSGKFSTYGPEDGIPAGEYTAGLSPNVETMQAAPQVKPVTVTTSEALDGGELKIDFESTGKQQESILPPL